MSTDKNPNPDLDEAQKTAMKNLMDPLVGAPDMAAVVVLRIMKDGTVYKAVGSQMLNQSALEEIGEVTSSVLQMLARERLGIAAKCGCASCVQRRAAVGLGGPIAQA